MLLKISDASNANARDHNETSRLLEHKMERVVRGVGAKPLALSSDYDAPTVWGSVGAIGAQLDTVVKVARRKTHHNLAEEVAKITDPFRELLVDTMAERAVALDQRISTLKSFMIRSTKKMNEKIDFELIESAPKEAENAAEPAPGEAPKPEWLEEVMKLFEQRLEGNSARIARLTAPTNRPSVSLV
jgi:hypothetical protein